MLKTAQKIFLAKIAFRAIMLFRQALGKGPGTEAVRGGIRWQLDLRQGIDFSIFLLGGFEPVTLKSYRRWVKPGDVVLDIGANIGAHTLPLAALAGDRGQVLAFEPTAFAFNKLQANIRLNPRLGRTIHALQIMLVADANASLDAEIFSSWPLTEEEGLHEHHRGQLMSTTGATSVSLDQVLKELAIDRVDFVKMDVDGHEYDVIRGARTSLAKFRPRVLMELAPYLFDRNPAAFEGLIDCFRSLDYTLQEVNSGRSMTLDAAAIKRAIPVGASVNVIAIPRR
jgi:FkbM family methyltransferase